MTAEEVEHDGGRLLGVIKHDLPERGVELGRGELAPRFEVGAPLLNRGGFRTLLLRGAEERHHLVFGPPDLDRDLREIGAHLGHASCDHTSGNRQHSGES